MQLLNSSKLFKLNIILVVIHFVMLPAYADGKDCDIEIHPCNYSGCDSEIILSINIPIQEESNANEYSRQYFKSGGSSWADDDKDCMNTRHEVLAITSIIPPELSANGCSVLAGLWYDPYLGRTFEDPSELDIDHFVPLKEAFVSGAWAWNNDERVSFANQYTVSANLIPVWNSLNRSKSAREPGEWLPPNNNYRCEYINRWSYAKWFTQLYMDEQECRFIKRELNSCMNNI